MKQDGKEEKLWERHTMLLERDNDTGSFMIEN
jgi:hypothetical protein